MKVKQLIKILEKKSCLHYSTTNMHSFNKILDGKTVCAFCDTPYQGEKLSVKFPNKILDK